MNYPKIRLDKVCRITMGQAPSGDSYNFEGEGLPLIAGAGDFGKETPEPKKFTTASGKKSEKGEIILCIRATIGDLNWSDKEYCLGRGVAGLFGHMDKLDQKYLWHWLTNATPFLKSKGKGATFLQVTKEDICSLEISLPPLEEQRRIASILDKADELRQKRQQAFEKLDHLLKATFIDMFGDPLSNPKGFDVAKLSEQVDLIQIGPFGTQLHQEDYIENGIPLINPSHIKNGKIIPNHKLTVSKLKYEELTQYHLRLNDVLLGRRGEMGRCAVVTKKEVGWLCGTGSLFIRPNVTNMNPFFLELLLSSDSIKKYLENVSQGQTMANLNKSIVGAIPLILPSIEIQNKFFIISEKIDKMKSEFKNAKNQANNLFESLQNKAFSGTL